MYWDRILRLHSLNSEVMFKLILLFVGQYWLWSTSSNIFDVSVSFCSNMPPLNVPFLTCIILNIAISLRRRNWEKLLCCFSVSYQVIFIVVFFITFMFKIHEVHKLIWLLLLIGFSKCLTTVETCINAFCRQFPKQKTMTLTKIKDLKPISHLI